MLSLLQTHQLDTLLKNYGGEQSLHTDGAPDGMPSRSTDDLTAWDRGLQDAYNASPILFNAARDLLVVGVDVGPVLCQLRNSNSSYPSELDDWETLMSLDVERSVRDDPLVVRAAIFHSTLASIRSCDVLYPYIQHQVDRDRAMIQEQLIGELHMIYHSLDCDTIYTICSHIGMDPSMTSLMIESREGGVSHPDSEINIRSSDSVLIAIGVLFLLVLGYYSYHRFSKTCTKTTAPDAYYAPIP